MQRVWPAIPDNRPTPRACCVSGSFRERASKYSAGAPLGDPIEIRFRGFSLTLRPEEADCLLLEKL